MHKIPEFFYDGDEDGYVKGMRESVVTENGIREGGGGV